jgi:hypothetical protein
MRYAVRMTRHAVLLLVLGMGLILRPAPATAHHSMTMFEEDPAKRLMLKGTVLQWVWANPHCLLELSVPGGEGQTVRWVVETSNPLDMINRGWSKTSLKPGDAVVATVRPIKTGKPLGIIVEVQLADGRILGTTNAPAASATRQ